MIFASVVWWFNVRWLVSARRHGILGSSPEFDLLMALNWFVVPLRSAWWRLPFLWDMVASILVIGLFWYWIALNIERLRNRQTLRLFKWRPLRMAAGFLFVAIGLVFGLVFAATVMGGPGRYNARFGWEWLLTVAIELGWCVILIFFGGRDAVDCLRKREPLPVAQAR